VLKGTRVKALKIILLLLLPAIALGAFVVVQTGAVPYKVYAVTSGSMSPTIPTKSAVVVRENDYSIGQVITFIASGETVTHRLISVDADGSATTKGDGNKTNDPWQIPTSQIIGGVISAPPQLGYWLIYLKQPIGALSVVMAVLLWMQVWSLTKPPTIATEESPPPVFVSPKCCPGSAQDSQKRLETSDRGQPRPFLEGQRLGPSRRINMRLLEIGSINQAGQGTAQHFATLPEAGTNQWVKHVEGRLYRRPVMTI